MIPEHTEDLLEAQILKYTASRPQSLNSLIGLTASTSAKVSWVCQNLRAKGILGLNRQGLFCLSEPTHPKPSPISRWRAILGGQSLENSQPLT